MPLSESGACSSPHATISLHFQSLPNMTQSSLDHFRLFRRSRRRRPLLLTPFARSPTDTRRYQYLQARPTITPDQSGWLRLRQQQQRLPLSVFPLPARYLLVLALTPMCRCCYILLSKIYAQTSASWYACVRSSARKLRQRMCLRDTFKSTPSHLLLLLISGAKVLYQHQTYRCVLSAIAS